MILEKIIFNNNQSVIKVFSGGGARPLTRHKNRIPPQAIIFVRYHLLDFVFFLLWFGYGVKFVQWLVMPDLVWKMKFHLVLHLFPVNINFPMIAQVLYLEKRCNMHYPIGNPDKILYLCYDLRASVG